MCGACLCPVQCSVRRSSAWSGTPQVVGLIKSPTAEGGRYLYLGLGGEVVRRLTPDRLL